MNTKLSLLGLAALTFAVGAQAQSDRKGTAGAGSFTPSATTTSIDGQAPPRQPRANDCIFHFIEDHSP